MKLNSLSKISTFSSTMVENSISRLDESAMTSTSGLSVLPDATFSQPVSCVQHSVKCSPVLSESSSSPNIFTVSVTGENPLRQMYYWDMLAQQIEEYDHHRLRDALIVSLPPFSVFEYIKRYSNHLDAVCYCGIRTDVNDLQVWEHLGERLETAGPGYGKRWN